MTPSPEYFAKEHVADCVQGIQSYVCRITDIEHETCVFEVLSAPYLAMLNADQTSRQLAGPRALSEDGWCRALVCPFIHDPEGLSGQQRNMSLNLLIMCGIPSVLEMRAYLLMRPGRQLSSWDRMNRSAIALMDWILASNRSHIIQDQPISPKDEPAEVHDFNEGVETTFGDKPIRGHLQFRFAQGAPDKEHRFTQQYEEHTVDSDGVRQKFPTLFAWHGSPLGNWHSIIRTGLDFENRLHGRAYGDGVYLSPEMAVSSFYSEGNKGSQVNGPRLVS